MKYIMLEIPDRLAPRKVPILFPDMLVHEFVAQCIKKHPGLENARVVSAGDFSSMEINGNGTFGGESETCGVQSHPDDGRIVQTYDYFHGV
jgi:hypothetical protein